MNARSLRVFRKMAESRGHVFPIRSRWRGIVRALARKNGWTFTDSWLWLRYQNCDRLFAIAFSR